MKHAKRSKHRSPAPLQSVSRSHLAIAALLVITLACIAFVVYSVGIRRNPSDLLRLDPSEVNLSPVAGPQVSELETQRIEMTKALAGAKSATLPDADPNSLVDSARSFMRAGDVLAARRQYSRALEIAGPNPALYEAVGKCNAMLGQFDAALRAFRETMRLAPTSAGGYIGAARALKWIGHTKEMVNVQTHSESMVGANDIEGRLLLAQEYDRNSEVDRALRITQSVHTAAPSNSGAAIALASLLIKVQRGKEAIGLMRSVVTAEPSNASAHKLLATLLRSPKLPEADSAQVEHHYLRALELDPADSDTCVRLGTFYLEGRRGREAAIMLGLALAGDPGNGSARLLLSSAYEQIGDAAAAKAARAQAKRILDIGRQEAALLAQRDRSGRDPAKRLALAAHYQKAGRERSALVELQAAHTLAPSKVTAEPLRRALAAAGGNFPAGASK